MYRLILETLLGLTLEVDSLRITPCMPAHWDTYKIHYRHRETVYHITVRRGDATPKPVVLVTVDGLVTDGSGVNAAGQPQGVIALVEDRREHHVTLELRGVTKAF